MVVTTTIEEMVMPVDTVDSEQQQLKQQLQQFASGPRQPLMKVLQAPGL